MQTTTRAGMWVWARASGAAVVLTAVVAGVPALLLKAAAGLGVTLLPHQVPTLDQVRRAVLTPDSSMHTALVVLFALMWALWAAFTASTAREAAALARSRGRVPAPPLPRLDVLARPAAQLVAVVVMAFTGTPTAAAGAAIPAAVTAATTTTAPARTAATTGAAAAVSGSSAAAASVPAPRERYLVRRRDTLWSIAEHILGDPMRWKDLAALNPGVVGPAPDFLIRDGATLALPAPPPAAVPTAVHGGTVVVRRGDTLSQIAAEHATTWTALWPDNTGRGEPGGVRLVDPDHIEPGWTVDVPTAVQAQGHTGQGRTHHTPARPLQRQDNGHHAEPPPRSAARATPPGAASQPGTAPAGGGGQTPASPATRATRPAPAPAPAPTPTPSRQASAAPSPAHGPTPDAQPHAGPELPIGAFAGGGASLAGVLALALARSRRRQSRSRRPGRVIAEPPPQLVGVEAQVLAGGASAAVDVTWLDQALRSLMQAVAAQDDAQLPDVLAVRMTEEELELMLVAPAPHPPAPWAADESATRWSVRRQQQLPYDLAARRDHFAPFPMLASVGFTPAGERWLVDLERVGALALTGDRNACLGLARFMATELALNPWSELLQVTLIGFGAEMAQANPDRLRYAGTAGEVLAEVSAQVRDVDHARRDSGVDVLTGRLGAADSDAWAPHVVLLAPQADPGAEGELRRLLTGIREHRSRTTVAVVLADPATDAGDAADAGDAVGDVRWRVTVDAARVLRIPALGLELTAQHLTEQEAGPVAQLAAAVSAAQDDPAPPARGDAPWEQYADVCGNLRPGAAAARPATAPAAPGLHPTGAPDQQRDASVLPLAAATYLQQAATTEHDLQALAPGVRDQVRRRVEDADPYLVADLEDWADPSCPRPKVSLLGPVTVRAQGSLPARSPRLEWNSELVAYLATRPRGVSTEQLGTALWPDDPDVAGKTVLRQAVLIARKWLGKNPRTGQDYIPARRRPGADLYRVQDGLVDADLFRRLRLRGMTRGGDGVADLRAALDLVTGPPFDRRRAEGYSWLAEAHLDHEYTAMVVDVAHLVATHHLAAGDPEQAAAAAQVALLAGSLEDIPLLDLVAACDALGNRSEADAYVRRILGNHDAEIEEDLPPRTAQVLLRRHWLPRSADQAAKTG